MRAALSLVLALAVLPLAGCASSAQIRASSELGAGMPPTGAAVSGAQVEIDLRTGSGARALAAAAALWALFHLDGRGTDSRSSVSGDRAPPMAQEREINAQDCTRPIERPGANLLCK